MLLVLFVLLPSPAAFADGDGPALTSLTISPNPGFWNPGPVGPVGREFHGHFEVSPNQITVTAVPQDPEAIFTINGRAAVSGEPMTFAWDKWTPWLDLDVAITDPEGNSGQYIINLFKNVQPPFVTVEPYHRVITGLNFNPSATAMMTIRSTPGGVILGEATASVRADGGFFWELYRLGIPVLLLAGMEVTITDGEVTGVYVISPLSIDEVDLDTDTISGSGAPGAGIELIICPTSGESVGSSDACAEPIVNLGSTWPFPEGDSPNYDPRFPPPFIFDASGHWEVDLSLAGIDITSDSVIDFSSAPENPFRRDWLDPAVRAAYDPTTHRYGITNVFWPPEIIEPEVLAILGMNAVNIEGLTVGIPVNLTVRSSAGGSVLFTDSKPADAEANAAWGMPPAPDIGVVFEPGMEVTVAWGQATISAVLDDIRVDVVDHELDRVSGTGPAGETTVVIVGDFAGAEFTLVAFDEEVPIGPDGSWRVDFTEDITVGMVSLAFLPGDAGFTTAAAATAVIVPEVVEENPSIAEASDETEVIVGTVASDGSLAQVAVPAGALPSGSSVRVAAITNTADLIEQVAVPEGTDVALGFSISAEAADGSEVPAGFAAPVAIEFTVEADTLPAGYDPDNLSIAFWNGARWAALQNVQAVTNPDGSVTLSALTDHFTLFTVVTDPAGAIVPGPADPLDEVSLSGLRSIGLAPNSAPPDREPPADEGGGGLGSLPAWIAGVVAAVILIAAGWFILRRKRRPTAS